MMKKAITIPSTCLFALAATTALAQPVLTPRLSLGLPEGEDVSDARWVEIVLLLMRLMQLSPNRPWVMVKHLCNHVHIITSRIDDNGRIWAGQWEALRLIEAIQRIERLFELILTPGLGGKNKRQTRLTSGQLRKMQRELERGHHPAARGAYCRSDGFD